MIRATIRARRLLLTLAIVLALVLPTIGTASAGEKDCSSGWVALTFDDGPKRGRTEAILDVLGEAGVRATFFSVGRRVAFAPNLALRIVREGHVVANHTWGHVDLRPMPLDEVVSSVRRTEIAFRAIGIDPLPLVRPPFLRSSDDIGDALDRAGYVQVTETVNSLDWTDTSPEEIAARVVAGAKDGAIVGLHDGHERWAETALATGYIIETLTSRGFCFGVLDSNGNVVPPQPAGEERSTEPIRATVDEMVWIRYLAGGRRT